MPSAFKKGQEDILARAALSLAVVLWPDCQIDKLMNQGRSEEKWFAGVAPVLPMSALEAAVQQSIRDHRRQTYFWVPKNDPVGIPESYVDFRHIWSVKQSVLRDRLATLSLPARDSLYLQLFTFLTYRKPKNSATCPACKAEFPAEELFETSTAE